MRGVKEKQLLVLDADDYYVLGEDEFGVPGLTAYELIGPYVEIAASGPLLMVHDGIFAPRHGIDYHPHRTNERLFYITRGAVDHEDELNQIRGHMPFGSLGRLTEGRRGMIHREWNNSDDEARAFILVYSTDPIPEDASFAVLLDEDAPRYEEAPGVQTKELIGDSSPMRVHGDIRFFAESVLGEDAELALRFSPAEGGLVVPLDGQVEIESAGVVQAPTTILFPPGDDDRALTVRASASARILRVVHGRGEGLVLRR